MHMKMTCATAGTSCSDDLHEPQDVGVVPEAERRQEVLEDSERPGRRFAPA